MEGNVGGGGQSLLRLVLPSSRACRVKVTDAVLKKQISKADRERNLVRDRVPTRTLGPAETLIARPRPPAHAIEDLSGPTQKQLRPPQRVLRSMMIHWPGISSLPIRSVHAAVASMAMN